MKKSYAIIIAIIVCIISLGIGFYFGKLNQNSNNLDNQPNLNTKSNFDKQTQCISLYQSIKEYLTDQYTWGEPNKQENYSVVNSVEVWYSSKIDGCVAYLDWDSGKYSYTLDGEDYYQYTFTQSLFNVNDGYSSLARCDFTGTQNGDCRDEFMSKMYSYKDL